MPQQRKSPIVAVKSYFVMAESRISKPGIVIAAILIIAAANAGIARAHVGLPSVSCYSCHIVHPYLGPALITETTVCNLCISCHNDTETAQAPPPSDIDEHREYHERVEGEDCVVPCANCHDPHTNAVISMAGVSHHTHIEAERGPQITCLECHDTSSYSYFKSGNDTDNDGKYSFSETDVCDPCHSPGGSYDGVNDSAIGAKYGFDDQDDPVFGLNWYEGVYDAGSLKPGKKEWCVGCHDEDSATIHGVSAPNVSLFWTSGHGRSESVECIQCHDIASIHIDGEPRTYAFDSAQYAPDQSGIAYQAGYRLRSAGGEVPLMIPCNYSSTFGNNAALIRDNAFRLCFQCHVKENIFDNTPGDGINSNFKASFPDPPRSYSYAAGSGADANEHVSHILNYTGPFADSDWDAGTTGEDGSEGRDTLMACFACHNVHGCLGVQGSTNEPMIRDGVLSGRDGYGFSYVIEDEDTDEGGYPVTSDGATQSTSVGAIFRNNTANMCAGSMCHDSPTPPPGSSYDATLPKPSGWGTYLEYYRPWADHGL